MIAYEEGIFKNYGWNLRKKRSHHDKAKNVTYCDNILTFDIETTSAWINEHGNIIRYHKGRSGDYWNSLTAVCLCYIWQFSIDDTVYYGRELRDFLKVLNELPQGVKCIIWVHNLSWEMHFLQDIFSNMQVFARMPHKPMKLVPEEYPDIEFRCTYMLTRLSLENWGKSLGVEKLTGTLEYNRIRTPITKLSQQTLDYAERDCIVVYVGIKEYLKQYKTQEKIPLTQTGTVRQEVKRLLLSDTKYHKWIKRLVPHDQQEYKILQNIFAGGFTHANRLRAGSIYYAKEAPGGEIQHYDFASHYPTMMCAMKYPSSPWAYLGQMMPKHVDFENYAYIFHFRFWGIQCKTYNTYIQDVKTYCRDCPSAPKTKHCKDCDTIHTDCPHAKQCRKCKKCRWYRKRVDNGRVISAYMMEIWVTELDYQVIQQTYKWDTMETLDTYRSRKDYLPKTFVEYILKLYENKTALKDVTEEEQPGAPALYAQSKQFINGLFGMAVTALCMADVYYDLQAEDEEKIWRIGHLTPEIVNQTLDELRSWSPRERRYFLSYSWGCWVTAWARYCLWQCILNPGNGLTERDVLYCDTDSIFILGAADYSWYDKWISEKLNEAMQYHGINPELTRPKDPKGRSRPLGIFTREENDLAFISLGAKRYLEKREDGKLYLTISGINKEAVYCLKGNMENFADGFIFDKDFPTVKKSLHTYIYNMPDITWPDGYKSTYKYGINLRPNGYHLMMKDEYKKLIDYGNNLDVEALPDEFLTHLRGRF